MNIQEFFEYLFRYIRQQSRGISLQELLIMWLIGIVAVHIICMLYAGMTGKKVIWYREVLIVLIMGYCCFGCQITLLRRVSGSRGTIDTSLYFGNLLGNWFDRQQFFYSFLNVLFFVPWGLVLGLWRWEDGVFRRIVMVTSYSFLTTIVIEAAQLATGRGFFELVDIITNVAGGFIGCCIACVLIGTAKQIFKRLREDE